MGPRVLHWLLAFTSASAAAADTPDQKLLSSFLGKYCLECHDSSTQEGDRDYENFFLPLKKEADLIDAKDIIDILTLKEMPPKKADQPTDEERLAIIRALRQGIADARGKIESTGGRTVMRRLSSREYENTLATLLDRRVDTLGLTADFPKEKTSHHIDTIGKSLVTSGFLVDQYFQAANRLIEARLGKPPTEPKTWVFNKNFVQYEELTGSHKSAFNFRYLCLYEQPNTDTRQGGYGHIEDFKQGVPVAGLYDIEVEAQAMHRDTHYDPKIFGIDFSEPFILGVVPGDVTKGHIHYPQAIEPLLGSAVVPDEAPTRLKFQVWLEAGQTPRFIFPNGPYESRASVIQINQRYKHEFKSDVGSSGVGRAHILKEGKLPHIRISEIKIHGPLKEEKGGKEEVAVFGPEGFQPHRALDQVFAFAEKAYRRPLNDADRAPIRKLYERRITENATPRQAALDAVKLVLCSPSFLYLAEVTDEKETALGPYDLASRLSYALWAAPPDAALLAAAKSGELNQTAVLKKHVNRMLDDKRVSGFVNGFLDSWLNFRDLGGMPPAREKNIAYYAEDLPSSMRSEARLFFSDLLKTNGPVTRFLHADYTFVDKKLAKLYDLPEQKTLRLADGFQRVSLNGNSKRGGLLGMAGVLTVSANGVETSPVTRGVWVSENILGIPPPPPPDEVPAIDADTTGATTIRERLAKHSKDPNCAECHARIDPLGFGLENFDPIGRWRNAYPGQKPPAPQKKPQPKNDDSKPKDEPKPPKQEGTKDTGAKQDSKSAVAEKDSKPQEKPAPPPVPKIDASGRFPSGETYTDFASFKAVLLEMRHEHFTRQLISKLLSYGTGRHMEGVDQYVLDDIYEAVKKDKLGLRTLIVESLTSPIFRSR